MTISAPWALTQSRFAVLVVVATTAPRCFANWIANVPTPPEPAWIGTFCPFFRFARSINTHAVKPTRGMEGRFFHGECFGLDRHGIFIHRDEFPRTYRVDLYRVARRPRRRA